MFHTIELAREHATTTANKRITSQVILKSRFGFQVLRIDDKHLPCLTADWTRVETIHPSGDAIRANDERIEIFNALVMSYNKLLKSKKPAKARASEWAMGKALRVMTLQRLLERHAPEGRTFSWQPIPQTLA